MAAHDGYDGQRGTGEGFHVLLSVRARDTSGNVSNWSAQRCTAAPLDDRALSAGGGWIRDTGSNYYAGTITRTNEKAIALTRSGVQTKRIALVATRCSDCGSVTVFWNGTLIKKISLAAITTRNKQVISVTEFTRVKSGTVTIKTLGVGSTRIDGLALSRV